MSWKQRLALAGGSAVEGIGEETGIDAVGIAGQETIQLTDLETPIVSYAHALTTKWLADLNSAVLQC